MSLTIVYMIGSIYGFGCSVLGVCGLLNVSKASKVYGKTADKMISKGISLSLLIVGGAALLGLLLSWLVLN